MTNDHLTSFLESLKSAIIHSLQTNGKYATGQTEQQIVIDTDGDSGIFTDGGNANRYYNQPVNDQKNLANTVAYQMINNFPPVYVDVKDINTAQNILAQTINRVNL